VARAKAPVHLRCWNCCWQRQKEKTPGIPCTGECCSICERCQSCKRKLLKKTAAIEVLGLVGFGQKAALVQICKTKQSHTSKPPHPFEAKQLARALLAHHCALIAHVTAAFAALSPHGWQESGIFQSNLLWNAPGEARRMKDASETAKFVAEAGEEDRDNRSNAIWSTWATSRCPPPLNGKLRVRRPRLSLAVSPSSVPDRTIQQLDEAVPVLHPGLPEPLVPATVRPK